MRSPRTTVIAIGGALAVFGGLLLMPAQAASPPLVPGNSTGNDPDEEWWEGITIPTEGVLPEVEEHPSLYVDAAGVATLQARISGEAPDPHGHYAMAWDRLVADADAAVGQAASESDDDKTKAAKATAFAWLVTGETTPPGDVERLTAQRSAGSVTLSWADVDRAESYQILRGGLTDDELDVVATVVEPTWTDTDVVDGTGYSYQVVAANDAGASEPSRTATAVPGCSLAYEVGADGAVIEAEQYSASSGAYEILDDLDRYGGRVAEVPPGSENKENPDLWGRYDLDVPEAGRYFVVVLGYGASGANDSVFVSVDNSPNATVNLPVGEFGYRQSPTGFDLEEGFHTLLIKAREDGAQVDRFVVYPEDSIPDDVRFAESWTLPANPECGSGAEAASAPEAVSLVEVTVEDDIVALAWSGSRLAASYSVLRDGAVVATDLTVIAWDDTDAGGGPTR